MITKQINKQKITVNSSTYEEKYILGKINIGQVLSKKNREVTKLLAAANERIRTIPNPFVMFNQIILMESKGSSEIENIITTSDELYKEVISKAPSRNNASKTLRIKSGVKYLSKQIDNNDVILSRDIINIGKTIKGDTSGYRPTPGTKIINDSAKEVIHTPPQSKEEVEFHIRKLLTYINEGGKNDPITDSLLIHHAFEWIHPFTDGNGRVGRILLQGFLKITKEIDYIFLPISYFINKKRNKYYEGLKSMSDNQDYEKYLSIMFDFFEKAAQFTLSFARKFDKWRDQTKKILFDEFQKYHQDNIIDCLFYNVYTTKTIVIKYTKLNFRTVTKILDHLVNKGIYSVQSGGKENYYMNNLIKGDLNE